MDELTEFCCSPQQSLVLCGLSTFWVYTITFTVYFALHTISPLCFDIHMFWQRVTTLFLASVGTYVQYFNYQGFLVGLWSCILSLHSWNNEFGRPTKLWCVGNMKMSFQVFLGIQLKQMSPILLMFRVQNMIEGLGGTTNTRQRNPKLQNSGFHRNQRILIRYSTVVTWSI